jgi:hypothetical protein
MGPEEIIRPGIGLSVTAKAKPTAAAAGLFMTRYEQNPNHDDPASARRHDLFLALTALVIVIALVLLWLWG